MKNFCKKSFTLVELMIVIAVLAILASIVLFALNPAKVFQKGRDSTRLTDIQTLYKAISFMESWKDSVNIGSATTVYISLPDTSSTCGSYSLTTLPTGFTYNCVTEDNLKNTDATGWVPIDFTVSNNNKYLTSLPIDPVNTTSYYYSYNPGGSFEINAFLESQSYIDNYALKDGGDSSNAYEKGTSLVDMPSVFPHNWIKVPGNPLYGTSDFWVMQYEAKYSIDGRTGSDATDDCKSDIDIDAYAWNKSCTNTADDTSKVISSPLGSPLAGNLSHNEAKLICTELGGHLITNQEWMTIARNADQQPENWTSGIVGTGYLFNGNSGDIDRGYDGDNPEKGYNRNNRSFYILSNDNRIYDLSGNVYEHRQADINDIFFDNLPNDGGEEGWRWVEVTDFTTKGDISSWDEIYLTNSNWNSSQGIGQMYTNTIIQSDRVAFCGGNFSDSLYTGILSAAFIMDADMGFGVNGFRCVYN